MLRWFIDRVLLFALCMVLLFAGLWVAAYVTRPVWTTPDVHWDTAPLPTPHYPWRDRK